MESLSAALIWKAGLMSLMVTPPPGEHINPAAPYTVRVVTPGPEGTPGPEAVAEGVGDPSVWRLARPDGPVHAEVVLGLCTDDGAQCRVVSLIGDGEKEGRKGRISLQPPRPAAGALGGGGAAVRLIDFTAVWCPPCQQMAAEILHDPSEAALLAPFTVQAVDADRPDSWALKSRYAVGGYPTVLAVDASGAEVSRLVGYPGEAAMRAWLAGLQTAAPWSALAADPAATPEALARAAREAAEAGQAEIARSLLARAPADAIDTHLARLALDASPDDARWLAAHNAPAGDWIYAALTADPALRVHLPRWVQGAPPAQSAGWLEAAAEGLPPEAATAYKAAALSLTLAACTGDPLHDKGFYTSIASLQADLGDLPGALATLQAARAAFPAEFTWDYTAARLLFAAQQPGDAEPYARAAWALAYGDQRLRAAETLARVLAARNNVAEAVSILRQAIAESPRPDAATQVRTTRYLAAAEKLLSELQPR